MPKSGKEFITLLLTKAGIKIDEQAIAEALATPELATVQIPDSLITPIDNGLLSIETAKNNHPAIKGHYTAQALDSLDKELDRFMDEHKLTDEQKAELKAEKSSYKRATLLPLMIKKLEEQKASSGKGEKDTLQKDINELNEQLRQIKAKENEVKAAHAKEISEIRMGHSLGLILGGYKTKFDDLSPQVKDQTLKAIINNSLAADNAELTVDDAGQIILRKKDGNNFFGDDHTVLTPKTYLDKILARDKILITTDQNQNNNNNSGGGANNFNRNNGYNQNQNRNNNNGGNGNGNGNGNQNRTSTANSGISDLVNESLAAFTGNGQP